MGNAESGPELASHDEDRSNDWDDVIHDSDWDNNPDWAPVDNRDWVDQENNGDYRNTTPPQEDKFAVGYQADREHSYEEAETDEEDSAYMTDHGHESLMGASAAVFHYLEMAEKRQAALQQDDDDISVSERSAAVFKYLEEEANRGNAEPMVKFLETASVVSQILLDDAYSVSDASAAIFKVLDRSDFHTTPHDDPPTAIVQLWNDAQSVESADSVSNHSSAVFKLLDRVRSVDFKSVSEFSADIFKKLDDAKSIDSQSRSGDSVSNQSAAIFQLLEDMPLTSPLSNASTLALGNLKKKQNLYENRSKMPQIIEEHRDQHDAKSKYSETADAAREDYPEVGMGFSDDNSSNHPPPEATGTSNLSEEGEEYPIDLVFVENFDRAFNEFISRHPKFLMANPDLVHHLRVSKLQKLLEYMDVREREILTEMAQVKAEKIAMEKDFHLKLREASRKKAARQINLQSDLQRLAHSTKQMETKMTWKFVDACESRSKKQYQSRKKIRAAHPPVATREELIQQIPQGVDSLSLRDAVNAAPATSNSYSLSVEQDKDLRKFQVDNAFMLSEITVLKKQLAYQKANAKKKSWVEPVLLRMDATTMSKLKAKFLKKAGVQEI